MSSRNPQVVLVLNALKAGPTCGTTFLERYIPRYAARIHDLRSQGYAIEARACSRPNHRHETRQVEYVLIGQGRLEGVA